jgi:hypothetical protein
VIVSGDWLLMVAERRPARRIRRLHGLHSPVVTTIHRREIYPDTM